MSGEHRTSYPMGNIRHGGTPERPDWGPFCVECKESWPCEASELIAERDALAAKVARAYALADVWEAENHPTSTIIARELRAALEGQP